MRQALEHWDQSQSSHQHPCHHYGLSSDPVGEPCPENIKGTAQHYSPAHKQIRGHGSHAQGLNEEIESVELRRIPNGSHSSDHSEGHEHLTKILLLPENLLKRCSREFAFRLGAQESLGFLHGKANPKRHSQQDRGKPKRNPPAPHVKS